MTANNAINNNLNNSIFYKELSLTSSDIKGMFASPILFLGAPGANKMYNIFDIGFKLNFNTTQYAGGGTLSLRDGGGTLVSSSLATTNVISNVSRSAIISSIASGLFTFTSLENQAIYLSNATAAFTTGDSTGKFFCWYAIEDTRNPEPTSNNILNNRNGNLYLKSTVVIPSADVLVLDSTPYPIIPAPGANKASIVYYTSVMVIYNSAAYNNVNLIANYDADATALATWTGSIATTSSSAVMRRIMASSGNPSTIMNNKAVTLKASAAVTSGDSPLKVVSYYSIIDL